MPGRSSVFSSFRLAAVAVVLGVAVIGAVFYGFVNAHYIGLVVSRTLGPYSDSLSQIGFESSDPDVWQRIAARHDVAIIVEPRDGPPEAWDASGEPIAPDSPKLAIPVRAERMGPDGTRITLVWTVISFSESNMPLLGALIVMVVAIVGTTFWLLQRQIKPLSWLRTGVESVTQGDFKVRVPVVRNDEIGQVAQAFNSMTVRVGEMIDNRERLLADVSHELRSPIARMKVALELMPPGERLDGVARDLREMEGLIAALLEREALRSRTSRLQGEIIDLRDLVTRVIETYAGQKPGIELLGTGSVEVYADAELLRLLVQNILDNALKFSLPDSRPVQAVLERKGGGALLRVTDDGCGIPEGSEEKVLEPFVKLDPARGHHSGYGLGLNLCQRIAELHGGSIELRPLEPRGTEVVVTLTEGTQ